MIIYTPNEDQDKLISLENDLTKVAQIVGCPVLLLCRQKDILNIDEYESDDCAKHVVFDDLMNADKNIQAKIASHFTDGRHHKIGPVYLSQSYFIMPKDMRTNCSKVIAYDPPTDGEKTTTSKKLDLTSANFKVVISKIFYLLIKRRKLLKNSCELI